jgi:hypothetical protein
MARRKAQTYGVRASFRKHGGRLPARQSQHLFGAGPRFPVWMFAPEPKARTRERSSRPKADSANIQVVSQLLAGSRSGPGRSPGAARVPDLRSQARRAPHLVSRSRRLMSAPLSGRGGTSVSEICEAGIDRASPRRKPGPGQPAPSERLWIPAFLPSPKRSLCLASASAVPFRLRAGRRRYDEAR